MARRSPLPIRRPKHLSDSPTNTARFLDWRRAVVYYAFMKQFFVFENVIFTMMALVWVGVLVVACS